MKDSTTKALLNYSTSLTKVTEKRLESSKSKEEKIDIISKQFEEISKKAKELVENDNISSHEGKSELKLEFDKLNNRLDVIEATDSARQAFTTALLKSGGLGGSGDSSTGDSALDSILNAFGFDGDGKLELDEIIKLFSNGGSTITGITSALNLLKGVGGKLGALITNPWFAIPIAVIAGMYGLSVLLNNKIADVEAKHDAADEAYAGATQDEIENIIRNIKNDEDESIIDLLTKASKPDIDENEKGELLRKIDYLYGKAQNEVGKTLEDTPDKSTLPTIGANLAVDPTKVASDMRDNRRKTLTGWDYFWDTLIHGDGKDNLYDQYLASIDIAELGTEVGQTPIEVITNIKIGYDSLMSTTSKDYDKGINSKSLPNSPKYKSFDYTNPIKSIKELANEYCRLSSRSDVTGKGVTQGDFDNCYKDLLDSFANPIGRDEKYFTRYTKGSPNNNPYDTAVLWDKYRDQIGVFAGNLREGDGFGLRSLAITDIDGRNYSDYIYLNMPPYSSIISVYYSKEYIEGSPGDNQYSSLMTVSQQYKLLGLNPKDESKIYNLTERYYFLPIKLEALSGMAGVNNTLDSNLRITLNKVGIVKAFKSANTDVAIDAFDDYDESGLLQMVIDAQIAQSSYDTYSTNMNLDEITTNFGSYAKDTVIMGTISSYLPSISSKNSEDLAKLLEKYDSEELTELLNSGYNSDTYRDMLKLAGGDSSNLDTVIKNTIRYQDRWSTNKRDVIKSLSNIIPGFNEGDLDRIITKIGSDPELRKKYTRAKNSSGLEKSEAYSEISDTLGIVTTGMASSKQQELIDKIFKYYFDRGLYDEGDLDLDAAIYTYLGLSGDTYEDLSSSVDLWGMGTADEIKSTYGMSDAELIRFMQLMSSMDGGKYNSHLVADEEGNLSQVYSAKGLTSDSNLIKDAIKAGFSEIGFSDVDGTLKRIEDGVATILEGMGATIETAAGANQSTNNNDNNYNNDATSL